MGKGVGDELRFSQERVYPVQLFLKIIGSRRAFGLLVSLLWAQDRFCEKSA